MERGLQLSLMNRSKMRYIVLLLLSFMLFLVRLPDALSRSIEPGLATMSSASISAPAFEGIIELPDRRMLEQIVIHVYNGNTHLKTTPFVDGTFVIRGMQTGKSYLVNVHHPEFIFEPMRVDVAKNKLRVSDHKTNERMASSPIIRASGIPTYDLPPEPFDFLSMLKNPAVLIMLFGGIMAFVLPKLTSQMTPEERQAMRDAQRQGLGGMLRGAASSSSNNVAISEQQPQQRRNRRGEIR